MKPYSMTVPNVFPVLAFSFAGLVAVFVGYIATSMPMFVSIGMVLGVGAAILTFVRPQLGLGLIVFSMLLSPEFPIAQLAKRAVIVRLDDLLLIGVFFAWLTRAAIYKELPPFSKIPLIKPMSFYALITVFSTLLGIMRGDLKVVTSFFYVAKYLEYFLLYFMVVSIVSNEKQVEGYLWAGLITAVVVCCHAYYQMSQGQRPYAPFDIEKGTVETASLAGYLMIVMSVVLSFFVHTRIISVSVLLLGAIAFMLPPFLNSESRSTYIAMVPLLLSMLLFARRRRLILGVIAVISAIVVTLLAVQTVQKIKQRILYTFATPFISQEYSFAGRSFALEESAATRVESWKNIYSWYLTKHPLVGHGVTGVGLVDTNYPLMIGETGLIGLGAFLWVMFSAFRYSWNVYRTDMIADNHVAKSLNLALTAIMIGLCVQAVGVNTFIIIRVVEPFWFFAAITLGLNRIICQTTGVMSA